MAQATFSIRMDENLKKQFDALCKEFGMSASTAFNIFARAVVRERRIPFEIKSGETSLSDGRAAFLTLREEARINRIQDLSPEEIDAEIQKARRQEDSV